MGVVCVLLFGAYQHAHTHTLCISMQAGLYRNPCLRGRVSVCAGVCILAWVWVCVCVCVGHDGTLYRSHLIRWYDDNTGSSEWQLCIVIIIILPTVIVTVTFKVTVTVAVIFTVIATATVIVTVAITDAVTVQQYYNIRSNICTNIIVASPPFPFPLVTISPPPPQPLPSPPSTRMTTTTQCTTQKAWPETSFLYSTDRCPRESIIYSRGLLRVHEKLMHKRTCAICSCVYAINDPDKN